MNTNNSKQGPAINGRNNNIEKPSQSNLVLKLKENTPLITNSIDEFLKSVKRTKLKYQEMLNNNDEKGGDTSLEVKTDPTDSDLQTGCFTDVSYSGYFEAKKLPETMSRNTSLSDGSDMGTSATGQKDMK